MWLVHFLGFLASFILVVLMMSWLTNTAHTRLRENHRLILGLSVLLVAFSIAQIFYAFNFGDSWEVRMTSARYRRFWPEYYGGLPVGLTAILLSMAIVERWTTRAFHYFWGLTVCFGAYVTDEMFTEVGGYRGPSPSESALGWIGESFQIMFTLFPLSTPILFLSGLFWCFIRFRKQGFRFISMPGLALTVGITFAFYSCMNWAGFMWD